MIHLGRPQAAYRDFVDHTKTKIVLAERIRAAFDDLYVANKKAHEQSANELRDGSSPKLGKVNRLPRRWRPPSRAFRHLQTSVSCSYCGEKKERKN